MRRKNLKSTKSPFDRLKSGWILTSEEGCLAPRTNDKAYGKAQTALKDNEELTFSDGEIDAFLPATLRSTKES